MASIAVGAAGAAVFLYYSGWSPLSMRILAKSALLLPQQKDEDLPREDTSLLDSACPPSTWGEGFAMISRTLRFTYSETLGKWPLVDLAFGINFLTRKKGYTEAEEIYGKEGTRLQGTKAIATVEELLRLVPFCTMFRRNRVLSTLEAAGFTKDQILMQEGTGGLLRPAFVVVRDDERKTVLLFIRGTYSMKDTLTSLSGARVPFEHNVKKGNSFEKVTGYAHFGMAVAARWIAQMATPLLEATLKDHPGYHVKLVGHSMGGGTGALLSYILREKEGFEDTQCIAFGPAACMAWDLAESGAGHIVSVVNGFDIVPTFSAASADDLREEVTSSAWLADFRDALERIRVLRLVLWVAALLRGSTWALSQRAYFLAAACFRRPLKSGVVPLTDQGPAEDLSELLEDEEKCATASIAEILNDVGFEKEESSPPDSEDDNGGEDGAAGELRRALEEAAELERLGGEDKKVEEEAEGPTQPLEPLVEAAGMGRNLRHSEIWLKEETRFFPPGRLFHLVRSRDSTAKAEESVSRPGSQVDQEGQKGAMYESDRSLYGHIWLSRRMIRDHLMPNYKASLKTVLTALYDELKSESRP